MFLVYLREEFFEIVEFSEICDSKGKIVVLVIISFDFIDKDKIRRWEIMVMGFVCLFFIDMVKFFIF